MPVQFSLTSAPRLTGQLTLADLDLALELNIPHAQAEADRVGMARDNTALYWRMVFALLSVHSNFEHTCAAWLDLKGGEVETRYPMATLTVLRRWRRIQYPLTKARFISDLWHGVHEGGQCYWPQGLDDTSYRDYLRVNTRGLAWAKGSFAVMLVKGSADVACIDTHMWRLFHGAPRREQIKGPEYLELESRVRVLAQRHGVSTSVAQHALWSGIRGTRDCLLPPEEG